MTIVAEPLSNPADDDTDGIGLEVVNAFFGFGYSFSEIDWTRVRRNATDASYFSVIQLVGGAAGLIRLKGEGATVVDGLNSGDYVAFDSFIVWHIPAADWATLSPSLEIEGTVNTVNINPPID